MPKPIFNTTIRRILNKYKIDFTCPYFDDIIIFSSSLQEHINNLTQIFKNCKLGNIKLKNSKYKLGQTKINFLGYEIIIGTLTQANANIETIEKLKPFLQC